MPQETTDPVGTLQTALAHARRLLAADPALAEAQAREIIAVVPRAAEAHLILGLALVRRGELDGAAAALEVAADLDGDNPHVWRSLADLRLMQGDGAAADRAQARALRASVREPRLVEAADALLDNRLAVAEPILRGFLKAHPTDVAAIRMLAEVAARLGRYGDAEALLSRALELAPGFAAARHNRAAVLHRMGRPAEAAAEADVLLAAEPGHPAYLALKAAALGRIGEYGEAIAIYEDLLARAPGQPKSWMSYGHALKTVGRTADSVAAYRRATALSPHLGEAWWSLANLKTFAFTAEDTAVMRREAARDDLADEDRFHLDFALGKALEDAGEHEAAFAAYARANALRRRGLDYDAAETSEAVARAKALYTPGFFTQRRDFGAPAPDPIFVVGLPRSGSTLVEQILASHSQVEGTMELPDLIAIAKEIGGRKSKSEANAYPEILAQFDAERLRALGEDYLARTRVQRKTDRPLFIDKMPNNWLHVGLIHLILPKARIVDARRHPLGACFSAFKQHFARGQGFTYDLDDLGRYYADYVDLMAHYDGVLPGRVHRVIYERMVADPEAEIRALLAYCGLPFEDACLAFHETERPVRTASSEQVRRPIYADAADHWRAFEPWLEPLKTALGPALAAYPEAPPAAAR